MVSTSYSSESTGDSSQQPCRTQHPPTSNSIVNQAGLKCTFVRKPPHLSLAEAYQYTSSELQAVNTFARLFELDTVDYAMRKLLSAFALLRLCRYMFTDAVLVLSFTVVQLVGFIQLIPKVQATEQVNIVILQMYIAHSWILDEPCPLREWHKHLFAPYCSFDGVNSELMKLLQLQEFKLSVDDYKVHEIFSMLAPDSPLQFLSSETERDPSDSKVSLQQCDDASEIDGGSTECSTEESTSSLPTAVQ